jgi:hypothetical protein
MCSSFKLLLLLFSEGKHIDKSEIIKLEWPRNYKWTYLVIASPDIVQPYSASKTYSQKLKARDSLL